MTPHLFLKDYWKLQVVEGCAIFLSAIVTDNWSLLQKPPPPNARAGKSNRDGPHTNRGHEIGEGTCREEELQQQRKREER